MPRYNQPKKGATNWNVPLNHNFADLGVEVMNEVETFADLPDPTGAVSSQGVSRKYLVRENETIYRDVGEKWRAINSSGRSSGKFNVHLEGSRDPDNPRGGLANRIMSALDGGKSHLNITGAWAMDGEVTFSSGDFSPFGVRIDAWGASIEYDGSGWAFTNDNYGHAGTALHGGAFDLVGGFWRSTGNSDGFVKLIDSGGCYLYPRQTWKWVADGKDAVIYQLEKGDSWCESNHLGGRHHLLDIGIKSVAPLGTSFQDNYVDNIHLSGCKKYGFDLSGNWIDCKFQNPTVIANEEGATFLRNNGNMGGTVIDAPEAEDAGADLNNMYLIEIGPAGIRGPHINGGRVGPVPLTLFNTGNESRPWTQPLQYELDDGTMIRGNYGRDSSARLVLDNTNLKRQTARNPNGPWETQGSL